MKLDALETSSPSGSLAVIFSKFFKACFKKKISPENMPDAFFYEKDISWLFPSPTLWPLLFEFNITLKSAEKVQQKLHF